MTVGGRANTARATLTSLRALSPIVTERTVSVEGMSCTGCEQTVEERLEAIDGVESATADHESGTVDLTYDDDAVSSDDIEHAVDDAGYALAA